MCLKKEKPGPSIVASSYVAVAVFFIYNIYIATVSFLQFSFFDIFLTGLLFLFVFIAVDAIFSSSSYLKIRMPYLKELALASVVLVLMVIYSDPGRSTLQPYIKTFPLLEISNGLGFHQDTAYHVSLIQSIMNYGYPSTAQHGVPFNMYHVLSHYVDAAILKVNGLNPFDSYGLMYRFKVFIFISAALILISRLLKEGAVFSYILAVFLFVPLVLGSWHGVLSHGLWVASLVLLLSYGFVQAKMNVSIISNRDIFLIWLVVVVISLAKISTGFMMSVFIGFFLFFRFPRRVGVYVYGMTLLLFFYFYGKLFALETSSSMIFSNVSFKTAYDFFLQKNMWSPLLVFLCFVMVTWLFMFLLSRKAKYLFLFLSCVGSVVVLYFVTTVQSGLNSSEIWYFVYGFSSVVCLFFLSSILDFVDGNLRSIKFSEFSSEAAVSALLLVIIFFTLTSYPVRSFTFLSARPNILYSVLLSSLRGDFYYAEINKKLSKGQVFSSVLNTGDLKEKYKVLAEDGIMFKLNLIVEKVLADNVISKRDMYMYIPKAVFQDQIAPLGGPEWAGGFMVYAITGIPLVNGVKEKNRTYGLSGYREVSYRVNRSDFSLGGEFCLKNNIKYILIVNDLKKQDYNVVSCAST